MQREGCSCGSTIQRPVHKRGSLARLLMLRCIIIYTEQVAHFSSVVNITSLPWYHQQYHLGFKQAAHLDLVQVKRPIPGIIEHGERFIHRLFLRRFQGDGVLGSLLPLGKNTRVSLEGLAVAGYGYNTYFPYDNAESTAAKRLVSPRALNYPD